MRKYKKEKVNKINELSISSYITNYITIIKKPKTEKLAIIL